MLTRTLPLILTLCSLLIQPVLFTMPAMAESRDQNQHDSMVFGVVRAELSRLTDLVERDQYRASDELTAEAFRIERELVMRSARIAERFDRKLLQASSQVESTVHEFEGSVVLIESVSRLVGYQNSLGLGDTERGRSVRELNEMLLRSLDSLLEDWSAMQTELLVHLDAFEQLSSGTGTDFFGSASSGGLTVPEGSEADRVLSHGFSSVMSGSAVVPLLIAGHDPGYFLETFEVALMLGSSVGGLDGRNDAASAGYAGGSPDRDSGRNPLGGIEPGYDEGMFSSEGEEESSLWDTIVELVTGDSDDAQTSDEGSGDAKHVGKGVSAGKIAAKATTTSPTASQSPSAGSATGRLGGAGVGSMLTFLTANTDSPDSKRDEMYGWAAFLSAFFGKAPIAGMASMDEETAKAVREGEGATEYVLPESQGLPDHVRDPSAGWGDEVWARRWFVRTGGGHTTPTNEGVSEQSTGMPIGDHEGFVAQYYGPIVELELPTEIDDNRDWEFNQLDE